MTADRSERMVKAMKDNGGKDVKLTVYPESGHFSGSKVTDAGLEHVAELTSLKILSLRSTYTMDTSLDILKKMANLRRLDIRTTKITDAGMVHVGQQLSFEPLQTTTPQSGSSTSAPRKSNLPNKSSTSLRAKTFGMA